MAEAAVAQLLPLWPSQTAFASPHAPDAMLGLLFPDPTEIFQNCP
jgi:hypothetical protein